MSVDNWEQEVVLASDDFGPPRGLTSEATERLACDSGTLYSFRVRDSDKWHKTTVLPTAAPHLLEAATVLPGHNAGVLSTPNGTVAMKFDELSDCDTQEQDDEAVVAPRVWSSMSKQYALAPVSETEYLVAQVDKAGKAAAIKIKPQDQVVDTAFGDHFNLKHLDALTDKKKLEPEEYFGGTFTEGRTRRTVLFHTDPQSDVYDQGTPEVTSIPVLVKDDDDETQVQVAVVDKTVPFVSKQKCIFKLGLTGKPTANNLNTKMCVIKDFGPRLGGFGPDMPGIKVHSMCHECSSPQEMIEALQGHLGRHDDDVLFARAPLHDVGAFIKPYNDNVVLYDYNSSTHELYFATSLAIPRQFGDAFLVSRGYLDDSKLKHQVGPAAQTDRKDTPVWVATEGGDLGMYYEFSDECFVKPELFSTRSVRVRLPVTFVLSGNRKLDFKREHVLVFTSDHAITAKNLFLVQDHGFGFIYASDEIPSIEPSGYGGWTGGDIKDGPTLSLQDSATIQRLEDEKALAEQAQKAAEATTLRTKAAAKTAIDAAKAKIEEKMTGVFTNLLSETRQRSVDDMKRCTADAETLERKIAHQTKRKDKARTEQTKRAADEELEALSKQKQAKLVQCHTVQANSTNTEAMLKGAQEALKAQLANFQQMDFLGDLGDILTVVPDDDDEASASAPTGLETYVDESTSCSPSELAASLEFDN